MSYPKWKYHRSERPIVVNDSVEEEALGEEWADTPAAFLDESGIGPVEAAVEPGKRRKR